MRFFTDKKVPRSSGPRSKNHTSWDWRTLEPWAWEACAPAMAAHYSACFSARSPITGSFHFLFWAA